MVEPAAGAIPGASEAGSDESEPLLPPTASIEHKESVYSFMLFQAPLSRRRAGHYWTTEVFLAFALLVLNVTLQVGLTLIAGSHIVERSIQFKTSLVSGGEATMPWERVIDHVQDGSQRTRDYVEESLGAKAAPVDSMECCNGAECAELNLPCCSRSGASPHKPFEPMRKNLTEADVQQLPGGNNVSFLMQTEAFLSFRKPGKKKKKDDKSKRSEPIINSLCQKVGKNETLHCTPLSYGFIEVWDELDRDGDGMWTLEEARADEANLGCRLGLPVEEVFRSTCRGVQRDNEDTSEHPPYNVHLVPLSVSERRAVPKSYFDWWRGLAVICVAHDVSRCGELISKGLFDGAIGAGHRMTKGGVQDLDSALDYCQRLLRPGGMCEKTLPGAYMMYRSRVTEKCGAASYSTGTRYSNPYDDRDVMSTIAVGYSLVDQYKTASSLEFCFFQGLILFLWFVNLVGELKAIIQLGDFIYSFEHDEKLPLLTPGMRRYLRPMWRNASRTISGRSLVPDASGLEAKDDDDSDDDAIGDVDGEGRHVITKISKLHKCMCTMMLFIRVFLLIYMFHVGSMFLLTNHKYDDLLLNAVALAFIFELPEFLYTFLVSDQMKSDLEGAHTADYVTALPTKGFSTMFFSKSLWGILIIPVIVVIVVLHNFEVTTMPSLRALQCTCFQDGSHCDVSTRFSKPWWDAYWKDIAKMFEQSSVFR
jgi:hypothetical protein